jgi:hypothetical protein
MRIAIAMIVRNEAKNIAACVEPIRDIVDEMIVVDTGSTDGTQSIAAACGAHVYEHAWSDSFAAARNAALGHVTADWVLSLDADDRIVPSERQKLGALFEELRAVTRNDAFTMSCVSIATDGVVSSIVEQVRLFPRARDLAWEYRVHEQIVPALERAGCTIARTDIRIVHVGYTSDEALRAKRDRNLRLATLDCADRPTDPLPMCHRAALVLELGNASEAAVQLSIAAPLLGLASQTGQNAHIMLVRALREIGDHARALAVVCEARIQLPRQPTLAAMEAELHILDGHFDSAARALSLLELDKAVTTADFYAAILIGELWIKVGLYSAAESAARNVLARRPTEGRAWLVLADALLAQGKLAEYDRVHENLLASKDDVGSRLLRAARLHARGEIDAAISTLHKSRDDACEALRRRLGAGSSEPPVLSCLRWPWSGAPNS